MFSGTLECVKLPTQGSSLAAGWDLYSPVDVVLRAGEQTEINTRVKVAAFPPGTFGKIEGRSGLARKRIVPVGGVVDPDYEGEISVLLENRSQSDYNVQSGDKIAQLVFIRAHITADPENRTRGDQGFGSSGK